MRILKLAASAIVTIALVIFLNNSWNIGAGIPPLGKFLDPFHGFWQSAETSVRKDENLSIKGLKEPVTIIYDSLLIPHIFANNEEDLFTAQGYITARDRLWQMEFQVMAGSGRISEIIGEKALDFDRSQRRLGMVFGAENALRGMEKNPKLMSAVTSYTNGVNAYIESLSYEDLAIEYKLLNYKPEAWTTLKVGLFFMNMAKTLNMGEHDLQMTNALHLFGKETVDILYPDHELNEDPIGDNPGGWKFDPLKINDSIPLAVPQELVAQKSITPRARGIGSNNWVVAGSKTASGSPIVCNDPHLPLSMPSIWHVVHLNAPGINTMGAAFPGSPCVILGFNDSIAWGCTNAQRDLVDWYKIQFKDGSKNEYMSDGQWKPSKKVVEKFVIKGREPFYDTIVFTHHGPVVSDDSFHPENERKYYALRWISHDESQPLRAFYELDHAKNYDDYVAATNYHDSPAQNFVFGSVAGDIAIRVQGKFPVRRKNEGKFVLDGTTTSSEWQAFIPDEHNVLVKNPERGFLLSANQYPADATYPYYIQTGSYFETYRNRRIKEVLAASTGIKPQDMMKLQNDTYNWQAAESLPAMLAMLDSAALSQPEKDAARLLKGWDFQNSIESVAAIYYEKWWTTLNALIWDEMHNEKYELEAPSEYTTIKLLKEQPDLSFFDIVKTPSKENARDLARLAFAESIKGVDEWKAQHAGSAFRWSDFKDTYVQHLLMLQPFGYHVTNGGNSGIINASSHRWGPSWRMVVSLEKSGVKAWGVYPGGQSGNPGSPYYNNLLDSWTTGRYTQLLFTPTPELLKGHSIMTTTLTQDK